MPKIYLLKYLRKITMTIIFFKIDQKKKVFPEGLLVKLNNMRLTLKSFMKIEGNMASSLTGN